MSNAKPEQLYGRTNAEWPAAEVVNPEGRAPVLLVCEHASNRLPADANNLGCSDEDLGRHIAVDIGAGDLTRALSARLDARAVLCTTSRLYIDCNRSQGDSDWIPECSDGTAIPGNVDLDEVSRLTRVNRVFEPFHDQVGRTLASLREIHPTVLVLPIHSFTPSMGGRERPHAAVIWGQVSPASKMLDGLRLHTDSVGDNDPYDGRLIQGHTFVRHAIPAGLPHFAVEVRQDLLGSQEGIACWAERLADSLKGVLQTTSPLASFARSFRPHWR